VEDKIAAQEKGLTEIMHALSALKNSLRSKRPNLRKQFNSSTTTQANTNNKADSVSNTNNNQILATLLSKLKENQSITSINQSSPINELSGLISKLDNSNTNATPTQRVPINLDNVSIQELLKKLSHSSQEVKEDSNSKLSLSQIDQQLQMLNNLGIKINK